MNLRLVYEDESPEFEYCCGLCGFALHNIEIAAEFEGMWIDYFNKQKGTINFVLCQDCWIKLAEMVNTEMRTGIARRRAYESLDKEDKKEKYP